MGKGEGIVRSILFVCSGVVRLETGWLWRWWFSSSSSRLCRPSFCIIPLARWPFFGQDATTHRHPAPGFMKSEKQQGCDRQGCFARVVPYYAITHRNVVVVVVVLVRIVVVVVVTRCCQYYCCCCFVRCCRYFCRGVLFFHVFPICVPAGSRRVPPPSHSVPPLELVRI